LRRSNLDPAGAKEFLDALRDRLRRLQEALRSGSAQVTQEHPPAGNVYARFGTTLADITSQPIPLAPAIRPPRPAT
jgi:hypothetical protein